MGDDGVQLEGAHKVMTAGYSGGDLVGRRGASIPPREMWAGRGE